MTDDYPSRQVAEVDLTDVLHVLDDLIELVELSAGVGDAQGQCAAVHLPNLRDMRQRLRDPADDPPTMDYGRNEWRLVLCRALTGRDLTGLLRRHLAARYGQQPT